MLGGGLVVLGRECLLVLLGGARATKSSDLLLLPRPLSTNSSAYGGAAVMNIYTDPLAHP